MENGGISAKLISNGRIALHIQKTRVGVATQIYSELSEGLIRESTLYPKLEKMRKNKKADRTKTAALAKKCLLESLKKRDMTMNQFNIAFKGAKLNSEAYQLLKASEEQAFKEMVPLIKQVPLYWWLNSVKGLGLRYIVKLLVHIKDPRRFHHPSALRKYCGTAPGMVRRSGKEAHFSPKLKGIMLGQIAKNFLMNISQYKGIYDQKKSYYTILHAEDLDDTEQKKKNKQKIDQKDWTPGKISNYSKKAMINRFVDELWMASFLVHGQEPPRNPYILEQPGHSIEPMLVPVDADVMENVKTHLLVTS